jgi:proteasome lid subunit RPN8/RPN11
MIQDIKQQIKDIVKNSEDGDIRELCGVVVLVDGKVQVRQIKNIAEPMSKVDYVMCPKELGEQTQDTNLFRKTADNEFVGFWHTHPHTSSLPSQIDIHNCFLNRKYFIYSVHYGTLNTFIIGGDNNA